VRHSGSGMKRTKRDTEEVAWSRARGRTRSPNGLCSVSSQKVARLCYREKHRNIRNTWCGVYWNFCECEENEEMKRRNGYKNLPSNPYDKTRRMRISIRGSIEVEIKRLADEYGWSISRTFSHLIMGGLSACKAIEDQGRQDSQL